MVQLHQRSVFSPIKKDFIVHQYRRQSQYAGMDCRALRPPRQENRDLTPITPPPPGHTHPSQPHAHSVGSHIRPFGKAPPHRPLRHLQASAIRQHAHNHPHRCIRPQQQSPTGQDPKSQRMLRLVPPIKNRRLQMLNGQQTKPAQSPPALPTPKHCASTPWLASAP